MLTRKSTTRSEASTTRSRGEKCVRHTSTARSFWTTGSLGESALLVGADDAMPYAATESVGEYLADDMGLKDVTPKGYKQAAANESEPTPSF